MADHEHDHSHDHGDHDHAHAEDEHAEDEQELEREARRIFALSRIRQYGDSVLRMQAREVESFDDDLERLVERMTALMHEANGVGLAANQVGVLRRLFVFADGEERPFAVVVAATGFTTGLERLIDEPRALDERGFPRPGAAVPGLFFSGYSETPRGQLFEASRAARRLAREVDAYLRALR